MMKEWREEEGTKCSLAPLPPTNKGRKFWRQRVNRNEEAAEEEWPVWETGKPAEGRKKEIYGGGGTRKEPRKWKAARGTRLQQSAAGAATVTGDSRGTSWDRPSGLISQEPRD